MPTRRLLPLVGPLVLLLCGTVRAADEPVHVLIWDERQPQQKEAYPHYLGNWIGEQLGRNSDISVRSVGIDDADQGLSDANLDQADVLIWWGHLRHGEVSRETARRIVDRIVAGKLSLITLHSGHDSRPFHEAMRERALLDAVHAAGSAGGEIRKLEIVAATAGPESAPGNARVLSPHHEIARRESDGVIELRLTWPSCSIAAWREDGRPSHVTTLRPDHPITAGLPPRFDIPETEMYNEPFQVPEPDVVLLEEKWDAGERFRAACLWDLGRGKVLYFRPGHETYGVFRDAEPMRVLLNATRWMAAEQKHNR